MAGPSTSKQDRVKAMQAAFFSGQWELFRTYFTPDVYYRVGNVAEATGPLGVENYLRELPRTKFQITRMDGRGGWESATAVLAEYTMQGVRLRDNRTVEYPCVDIYRFTGDRLQDWRVYPVEPTFIAAAPAVPFRPAPGGSATPPAAWATPAAFQQAVRVGNWERAGSYLTEDVRLRVGNQPEVTGTPAALAKLGDVFSRQVRPAGADFLGMWEFEGVLLTEMTVRATRVAGNQTIEYPCVESYRFAAGKISEWRIYPMEAALLAAEG
jgi:hypothetical protein